MQNEEMPLFGHVDVIGGGIEVGREYWGLGVVLGINRPIDLPTKLGH